MYDLGARYVTTTHNCDNAFGTAASTVAAGGEDHGLAPFGHEYVAEMNRLGMMIDLSHVSHQTMRDIMSITKAPVIFSHSGAYSVQRHLRHAPDDVLRSIKKNRGIVMATFPISGLLAEFEVLTLETLDLGAQLRDLLAQGPYQNRQLRGGADWATDLYQLAVHDHLGLPNTAEKEKGLVPFHPNQGRPAR